jgi:dihydroorotate dehydrogenase electron transfer subunit
MPAMVTFKQADMGKTDEAIKKGPFVGTVAFNRQTRQRFYRLGLDFTGQGANAFVKAGAGQFAELDLTEAPLPPVESIPEELADSAQRDILLRRPFSFCDIKNDGKKIRLEILYCVVGPSTLRMSTLKKGDCVSVLGPLGVGFVLPEGKKTALLVVGGTGAGPLLHLAKILTSDHPELVVMAFVSAKSANELPFKGRVDEISRHLGFEIVEFARYGIESMVATDDGSLGFAGFVTDCLQQWLDKNRFERKETIIYSCGPEVMLAKMARIAKRYEIDCQISMERRMACGIGFCQGCAVLCKADKNTEPVYKMCCTDGPVFDSREVIFSL